MRIVVDGRRGFGGAGFKVDVGEGDAYKLSFDGLRRAVGFFGGGGAALPMLELVDVRDGALKPSKSVLARRIDGMSSGPSSSDEERSIKSATGSSLVVCIDWRAGNPGLFLGCSWLFWGN